VGRKYINNGQSPPLENVFVVPRIIYSLQQGSGGFVLLGPGMRNIVRGFIIIIITKFGFQLANGCVGLQDC
jgi:hypothetical protein